MRMKKIFLFTMLLLFSLSGCSSEMLEPSENGSSSEVSPEAEETTESVTPTPEPTSTPTPSYEIYGGDIEVIADYSLPKDIIWNPQRFLIIQNDSDETYDISVSSLAYNEEGTMISATDGSIEGLGSGCVSIVDLSFDTEEDIYSYDTEINVSVSDFYVSVIQDLSYVQNDIEDGAIFQVTNNGEEPTGIVTGYALFFLNDTLVDYSFQWFFDDDTEIKPGRTISEQITTYEEFDRIEFYMTGYRVDW